MLYRLQGVRKSFGGKDVLKDVTWQHDPGRIVGLVGRNGAGKSTILRIIQGLIEPDDGKVLVAGGVTFASLEQAVEPEGDEPLAPFVARAQDYLKELEAEIERLEDAVSLRARSHPGPELSALLAELDEARERFEREGGYDAEARLARVLTGVGLPETLWPRPVGELSGGQKHRAQIARLLLTGAPVLLLDEPTNHLDLSGIEFLENWLVERRQDAQKAALVVSHDRHFLNSVCDQIIDCSHGQIEDYPGNYDTYRRLKDEREKLRAKAAEQQRKLVESTEDFIRKNIAGQKTKQAQSRRKMLAKLERLEAPKEDATDVAFRFEEARASGERVLTARGVVPGYRETGPLTAPVDLLLRRGDRVALWGPNGCGKTTLLKTLARLLPPLSGSTAFGTGVLPGYYDQEMADLSTGSRVIEAILDLDPLMKEGEARDFLALFDFRGDEVFQKVSTLSGGEKGRLSLARIVFGGANLLLLDEPTNHLDLDSRERLEEALGEFEGAVVFVSHDRWFVDRIATSVLEFRSGTVEVYLGNYSDLLARQRAISAAQAAAVKKPSPESPAGPVRRPGKEAKLLERQRQKAEKNVKDLEVEITNLEESLRQLEEALGTPEVYLSGERSRAVTLQRDELRKRLDGRILLWEEAARRLEEVPR